MWFVLFVFRFFIFFLDCFLLFCFIIFFFFHFLISSADILTLNKVVHTIVHVLSLLAYGVSSSCSSDIYENVTFRNTLSTWLLVSKEAFPAPSPHPQHQPVLLLLLVHLVFSLLGLPVSWHKQHLQVKFVKNSKSCLNSLVALELSPVSLTCVMGPFSPFAHFLTSDPSGSPVPVTSGHGG